jgi:hypothetical protein
MALSKGVAVGLGCATVALAGSPAVAADATPARLVWNAPASCPDAAAVQAQVQQLATPGSRLAIATAEAWVTEGRTGRWHLRLETVSGDAHGTRAIDAASCAELADSTALILSMPEPAAPQPSLGPDVPADRASFRPNPEGSRPSARSGPSAAVSAVTEIQSFPNAAAISEVALTFGWATPRARGEAWGALSVADWNAASHFQAFSLGVRGCPTLDLGGPMVGACLGLDGGVAGTGPAFGSHGNGVTIRGLAGPVVVWPLGARAQLVLHADLALAIAVPEVTADGTTATRSGRVSAVLASGVGFVF